MYYFRGFTSIVFAKAERNIIPCHVLVPLSGTRILIRKLLSITFTLQLRGSARMFSYQTRTSHFSRFSPCHSYSGYQSQRRPSEQKVYKNVGGRLSPPPLWQNFPGEKRRDFSVVCLNSRIH